MTTTGGRDEGGRETVETRPPRKIFARAAFGTATLSLLSALWAYLEHADQRREPLLALALAGVFFSLGLTLLLAFRGAFEFRTERGPRERLVARPRDYPKIASSLSLDDRAKRRRLLWVLGAATTGLLAIVLLPLRSLGTRPHLVIRRTAWRRGVRLLKVDGKPLFAKDLPPGTSLPFVAEGAPDDANSFGRLVRLHDYPNDDPLFGLRAFSSICTHAGCAVSIFLDESAKLVCPCHFSTFSAEDGSILHGPASAPLPELPIEIDADGYLIAAGDYNRPIGPKLGCAGCEASRRG